MSWKNYAAAITVNVGIPVALHVDEVDGREVLRVELAVRDHETGETIKVSTRRPVQPLGMLTNEEAAEVVRDLVRIAFMHEIDEAISISGERVFNPHRRRT